MSTLHSEELIRKLQLVRTDSWEFLKCVKTRDQVDVKNPIKPFPLDLEYLRLYAKLWDKERFLVVPKSRRMIMTWTNVALYTGRAMWNVGHDYAFVSKKESDADELVQRAKFIAENLYGIPAQVIPKCQYKYAELRFPELGSSIRAFPQGSDQLRQFTFTGIFADEMAFWENAQNMYASSIPTLEGGGRFTAVSSPGPGFFKRLVFDQLDV